MGRTTPIRGSACLLFAFAVGACASPGTPTAAPVASTCARAPEPTPCGAIQSAPTTPAPSPTEAAPPEPSPRRDPGTARRDAHGVRQVWVPGGIFRMGSDEGSAMNGQRISLHS